MILLEVDLAQIYKVLSQNFFQKDEIMNEHRMHFVLNEISFLNNNSSFRNCVKHQSYLKNEHLSRTLQKYLNINTMLLNFVYITTSCLLGVTFQTNAYTINE